MPRIFALSVLVLIGASCFAAEQNGLQISIEPHAIYKRPDPGHSKTESWYAWLLVQDDQNRKLQPVRLTLKAFKGTTLIESRTVEPAALANLELHSFTVDAKTPKISSLRKYQRREIYDFRLQMTEPLSSASDSMVVRFVGKTRGKLVAAEIKVPVSTYQQKTKLIFPFRGNGIVSQGSINDGGHANFANQYALDILGLTEETYGPQTRDKDENDAYAGWGREIIAPADGVIVYARNDVPDNIKLNEDPETSLWESLPEPVNAIAGNCVIIDHMDGEFSVMMHMRQGSIKVHKGEAVKAGQTIGNLGNSGDAYGPHLHYQLQNGPELFAFPSLPVTFSNAMWNKPMYRGAYFRTH